METKKIRCAIYTRKSTEEGLEKEFNTLEAQREAGLNYIKSQQQQGWVAIDDHYDDPGFSGGNINRPALQRLLADVAFGKVDMIVVYKIDRLTRSLLDFSKLIEVLDKNNCSFVAVTQHFNTYDSMGRLTLNVLLSFAQFEREVSAERIRDKVAASKQKGMWMGGTVPMGYNTENKKLIIDVEEARKVRYIFEQYLQLRSEQALSDKLNMMGLRPKKRILRDGREVHGEAFNHARISSILRNVIYTGKVPHKGKLYDGQHEAIISPELFQEVQDIKSKNRAGRLAPSRFKDHAILKGMFYCECCNSLMVSTKSNKKNRVYEYYTSNKAVKEGYKFCELGNIPAGAMDEFMVGRIKDIFQHPKVLSELMKQINATRPFVSEHEIFDKFKDMDAMFNSFSNQTIRHIIELLIEKVCVNKEAVKLYFTTLGLSLIGPNSKRKMNGNEFVFKTRLARRKRGQLKIILPDEAPIQEEDPVLLAITKAFKWQKALEECGGRTEDLAAKENVSRGYMSKIIRLTYLAPDIIEFIVVGSYPQSLGINELLEKPIPLLWSEQRKTYGFM